MKNLNNRKGITLVLNLMVILVFAILGTVVYTVVKYQLREVLYEERLAQSRYIAEAGLEDGLYEVYKNPSWKTGFQKKVFADGYYTVTVSSDSPPYVTATGYSQTIAFVGRAFTTVGARAAIAYTAGVSYGLVANAMARITGPAQVNAYDPDVSLTPTTFGFGGSIWSNAKVTTTAGAGVNGDVMYKDSASIAANTVYGTVQRSTYTISLPNHTCGACKSKNDNLTGITPASCYSAATKSLTVASGATCNMAAGTYYFANIAVNGTLNVNTAGGAATVYFNGTINTNTSCAINNSSKIPSRLLFYGEQNGNAHTFACPAAMHMYLEEAKATWNIAGPMYGRIWGETINVSASGALHVDSGGLSTIPSHVGWQKTTWSHSNKRQ